MTKIHFEHKQHAPFYHQIKKEVQALLQENPRGRYANMRFYMKALFFFICMITSYISLASGSFSEPITVFFCYVSYTVSALLLAINVGHDAVHHTVSKNRKYNTILYRLIFVPLGVSGYLWHMRHNKSHHVFPNVNGCDIDIDENPWLRLSPNHTLRAHQKFQYLYAPFVYWLVMLHTVFYQDFVYLYKKQLANMHNITHPTREYLLFAIGKMLYLASVIVPFMVIDLPLWQLVMMYLASTFIVSTLFVCLLIGTHFSTEVEFPELDEQGQLQDCWATHALKTSLDWNPTSRIANFITGGTNAHAAHHLFPSICHIHYPQITKIIQKIAREHELPYHTTTLTRMIRSHFQFLKQMTH